MICDWLQICCEWLQICCEYGEHVPHIRNTSKPSANAYESLRMLGGHAAIIANWWRMAFVSPFVRYSRQCKNSIKEVILVDFLLYINSSPEVSLYRILMVRRPSFVRRRPSSSVRPSSTMLKDLLRNRFVNQSQILCGASLGMGIDILFAASGSHDQDGLHAHKWSKPFKNLLLQNRRADFHVT